MAYNYKQNFYRPKNPEKYLGDVDKIFFRSSWEEKFMRYCDFNPNIIEWASEEIVIPYLKPTDKRMHRYFPDFFIRYTNPKGKTIQELIEIKPDNQKRRSRARNHRRRLTEDITLAINLAKWEAAAKWCNQRNIVFRILTEKDLYR